MTLNDLNKGFLVNFSRFSAAVYLAHFKGELRRNGWR